MFMGILIGDAYGAGFEFNNSMLVYNNGQKFYDHPSFMASDGSEKPLKSGRYTDDTQMSIAVAETLLGNSLSQLDFANNFVNCFKRDPIKGYAKGFYQFLLLQQDGNDFIKNIKPDSTRNGAAMRSVPIGFIKDVDKLKEVCMTQASLTHNTKIGIDSSIITALMSNYFLYDIGTKKHLLDYLKSHFPEYPFENVWTKPVPCNGISTVLAVSTAIMSTDTLQDTMIKSVSFGGDTDSVASIACGIQLCNKNAHNNFNDELLRTCDNGEYGLNYCLNLDEKLYCKFIENNIQPE